MQKKFRIALVNHAERGNPEHWDVEVSCRMSRAIRKARKLRAEGNKYVILFQEKGETLIPISLKSLGDPSKHISRGLPSSESFNAKRARKRERLMNEEPAEILSDVLVDIYRAALVKTIAAANEANHDA